MATGEKRGYRATVAGLVDGERHFWALAVAFFGAGDIVTTAVGLELAGVVELGPLVAPFVEEYGVVGMVALKSIALAYFYGLWRFVARPYSVGAPLSLALYGVGLTTWNATIVVAALYGQL